MAANDDKNIRADQLKLAQETDELAEEVKLLAINLAITLARAQSHEKTLRDLEPKFSELIHKANEASHQISLILQGIQNQKKMIFDSPDAANEVVRESIYNNMETSLNHVHRLSESIVRTITVLKRQQQVG